MRPLGRPYAPWCKAAWQTAEFPAAFSFLGFLTAGPQFPICTEVSVSRNQSACGTFCNGHAISISPALLLTPCKGHGHRSL